MTRTIGRLDKPQSTTALIHAEGHIDILPDNVVQQEVTEVLAVSEAPSMHSPFSMLAIRVAPLHTEADALSAKPSILLDCCIHRHILLRLSPISICVTTTGTCCFSPATPSSPLRSSGSIAIWCTTPVRELPFGTGGGLPLTCPCRVPVLQWADGSPDDDLLHPLPGCRLAVSGFHS